jgi:ubiquinone/menaquinone biosynthesis C-methylase UbiE
VLVSTDFSSEMIKIFEGKFADPNSDFSWIPGNIYDVKPEEILPLGEQTFDLQAYLIEKKFEESQRMVIGRCANNECLPFMSDTFDCYLGCLSLMLVDNHTNMLKEALRVC